MTREITAIYPSNIALVKYWGKRGDQLPCNASISMTLRKSYTEIKLACTPKKNSEMELEYYFEGKSNDGFRERIIRYVCRQKEFAGLLKNYSLRIDSKNSFPHSTGIASSASAFAAIAAAFLKAEDQVTDSQFNRKASRLARLGSGSACRSFYAPFSLWGKLEGIDNSSDEYAVPIRGIHDNFKSLRDSILIVEEAPKKISSSMGHALMKDHPYAKARYEDANNHCRELLTTLRTGNFESFISITEREALSLHAMMMTAKDYYMLMIPGTIYIINQIFRFRELSKLPVCFTLDAGPNVHLLYPGSAEEEVHYFIKHHLTHGIKSVIYDQAGTGGSIF